MCYFSFIASLKSNRQLKSCEESVMVVSTNLWSPPFSLRTSVGYDVVPLRSACDVVWAHWLIAYPAAHLSGASLGVSRLYLRIEVE